MDPASDEPSAPLTVLLVEDDDGDALLVAEHFADVEHAAPRPVELRRAHSVAEASALLPDVDCVLLDLALPDAHGLDALERVLGTDDPAVVVLTGRHDEALGVRAVAAGAQDYLLKDTVDGPMLLRAVRYAVERRRWDRVRRELWDAQIQAEENSRLERGLLPTPLLADPDLRVTVRYEPGGARRLLGGDFYDAVEDPDGTLHVVVGDVCGHGPDEAALGVTLRIAWRTMVLGGVGADDSLLPTLGRLLHHERDRVGVFATMALLTIDPQRRRGRLRLAGHPPPILLAGDDGGPARSMPSQALGRPVGVLPADRWETTEIELPPRWAMLLYTDGLIEGRPRLGGQAGADESVLDTEGLLTVLAKPADDAAGAGAPGPSPWHADPDAMLDRLLAQVRELTDERTDDLAAVLLASHR